MYNRYILKVDFKALSHANAYAEKLRETGLHCTQAGRLLSKRAVVCTQLRRCSELMGSKSAGVMQMENVQGGLTWTLVFGDKQ